MIPKILHQIWVGEEMPDTHKKYMETVKEKHPDWDYKLWTNDNLDNFLTKEFISRYDLKVIRPAFLVDLLRIEILKKVGGVYLDADTECQKPIDSFVKQDRDFITAVFRGEGSRLTWCFMLNCFFGTEKDGRMINLLSKGLSLNSEQMKKYDATGGFGAINFHNVVVANADHTTTIYGENYFQRLHHRRKDKINPDAYLVHHTTCSWKKGKMIKVEVE